jgi:hypothetical protein
MESKPLYRLKEIKLNIRLRSYMMMIRRKESEQKEKCLLNRDPLCKIDGKMLEQKQ